MPAQVFGSGATATQLYLAFNGVAPSNPIYNNWVNVIDTSGESALALQIGQATANITSATLAASVLANLGVSAATTNAEAFAALSTAVVQLFDAYPATSRGQIVLNMTKLLTGLEGNATYGTAAASFNNATLSAYTYASNTANTTPGTPTAPTGTFTLTTGADNITGTAGSDTISGFVDVATSASSTISAADLINGGAGLDVLNVALSGSVITSATLGGEATIAATRAANVQNVETLNVRNVTTDVAGTTSGTNTVSATVDASTLAGVTAVNADRSTGKVVVTNLTSGASAGMTGDGVVTNGAFAAGYISSATAATLNISGGTTAGAVTLSGTGLKSTTVTSTGASNTIGALTLAATTTALTIDATTKLTTGAVTNTTAPALATLTVKGAGAVSLSSTALESTVKTIDASANSGGLTVKLSSAADIKVTGSTGNDVITTNAVLTTGTVDAGAGTDTLDLGTNVGHANTSTLAAKYTNFETLRVNGTFDASLITGISGVELSGATNNISKLSATQAAAVTAVADIGATTLALATDTGTADVLNLTLGNGKGAAFDTGALTINGFETLNVKASPKAGNADQTSVIASITADKLTAINLSGTAVTLSDAATTKAVTIDASALTGDAAATPVGLTISGNVVTDSTVIGSAVKDVVTLGTGFATYNLAAGNDSVTATVGQLNTGANYNTLDAGAGTDTLTISNGANTAVTIVDNNLSKVSGFEKIVISTSGTADQSIQTGGWFDAAFKANGVDLTTTATTGDITIDMTSFTGNAKITATTAGTGAGEGAINIQTGSGNDTVTVTNATAGDNGVISTFAGNDTIVGSLDVETITGGKGTDTMTGGGGNDVFAFAAGDTATPSATVVDTITDFSAGNTDAIQYTGVSIGGQVGTAGAGVATVGGTGILSFNAADTSFAQHLAAAEAALHTSSGSPTAGAAVIWQEGTDSYVFISDATAGVSANDVLIKLVGVTAGAFTDGGNTLTVA